MTKKMISLTLALALILSTALIPAAAGAENSSWIMYVYTGNGRTLNVRSDPSSSASIIGRLNFGSAVSVRMTLVSGWSVIDYNGGVAYVQSRFLVSYQPGSAPAPVTPVTPSSPSQSVSALNAEFRTAVKVTPYTIVARPTRSTGWVNLRWAPSMDTEVISICRQGKELTVLAELKSWYQVEDPQTGSVGFISRQYVYRK